MLSSGSQRLFLLAPLRVCGRHRWCAACGYVLLVVIGIQALDSYREKPAPQRSSLVQAATSLPLGARLAAGEKRHNKHMVGLLDALDARGFLVDGDTPVPEARQTALSGLLSVELPHERVRTEWRLNASFSPGTSPQSYLLVAHDGPFCLDLNQRLREEWDNAAPYLPAETIAAGRTLLEQAIRVHSDPATEADHSLAPSTIVRRRRQPSSYHGKSCQVSHLVLRRAGGDYLLEAHIQELQVPGGYESCRCWIDFVWQPPPRSEGLQASAR